VHLLDGAELALPADQQLGEIEPGHVLADPATGLHQRVRPGAERQAQHLVTRRTAGGTLRPAAAAA